MMVALLSSKHLALNHIAPEMEKQCFFNPKDLLSWWGLSINQYNYAEISPQYLDKLEEINQNCGAILRAPSPQSNSHDSATVT